MGFDFSVALSGLTTASESIGVTGNNIANSNTTGFKRSTISFADVFTNSIGIRLNGAGTALQFGKGVRVAATPTNFDQGAVSITDAATNAAIEGNGFFVVADAQGAKSYTRAGDFTLDKTGYLVTPSGLRVQGYPATNGVITSGTSLGDILVPIGATEAPVVTTQATLRLNLNAADVTGTSFHGYVTIFDSKGASHKMDVNFTKTGSGTYNLTAKVDGVDAQLSSNGGALGTAPVALAFDSNGQLTSPNSISIAPDSSVLNGANLPAIAMNLKDPSGQGYSTNYNSSSGVASTDQDGYAPGELVGLSQSSDQNGELFAVFNNGQRRLLGQLALATFNSQASLTRGANNLYIETVASGQPSIGTPGSGGRGTVVGASLEQSNVDIATEFTNLIVAQRSFQANSRVITTISQTLQELLQIS